MLYTSHNLNALHTVVRYALGRWPHPADMSAWHARLFSRRPAR